MLSNCIVYTSTLFFRNLLRGNVNFNPEDGGIEDINKSNVGYRLKEGFLWQTAKVLLKIYYYRKLFKYKIVFKFFLIDYYILKMKFHFVFVLFREIQDKGIGVKFQYLC